MLLRCALFFLSGAAALVYELAWGRASLLVVGVHAWAGVCVSGGALLGLGLGAALAPELIRRWKGPALRLYGLLEIAAALLAAPVPLILQSLLARWPLSQTSADLLLPWGRTLASALLFLPSFTLLGATFPVLVRASARAGTAWLYASNALGALVGALVTGYILLPGLGIYGSHEIGLVLSSLAGLAALTASGQALGQSALSQVERRSALSQVEGWPVEAPSPFFSPALLLSIAGGFFAAAIQVLLNRALALGAGITPYALCQALSASLAAVFLGSLIALALPLTLSPVEGLNRIKNSSWGLALLALGGLLCLEAARLGERIPYFLLGAWGGKNPSWAGLQFHLLLREILVGSLLLAPFSALLPLTFRGSAANPARLYAANALATLPGVLIAGFFLLPSRGLAGSFSALGALALGLCLAGILILVLPGPGPLKTLASAFCGLSLALHVDRNSPSWDPRVTAQGRYGDAASSLEHRSSFDDFRRWLSQAKILYYRDGATCTVSVTEGSQDNLGIQIDGKTVASTSFGDKKNQLLLGHLPALLWRAHHGNLSATVEPVLIPGSRPSSSSVEPLSLGGPSSTPADSVPPFGRTSPSPPLAQSPSRPLAVVVGWGTGMTPRALARHPFQVQVCELSPEILEASRLFLPFDRPLAPEAALSTVMVDARLYIQSAKSASLEIITSDPIHPFAAGSGNLYTTEYFQACRKALHEGGVMTQWLPLYEVPEEQMNRVMATFASVFGATLVWHMEKDIILTAVKGGPGFSSEAWNRAWDPEVARDLDSVGFSNPSDLWASRLGAIVPDPQPGLRQVLVRDAKPDLEYETAKALGMDTLSPNLLRLRTLLGTDTDGEFRRAMVDAAAARWGGQPGVAYASYEKALKLRPSSSEARALFGEFLFFSARAELIAGQKDGARTLYNRARALGPMNAVQLSAWGSLWCRFQDFVTGGDLSDQALKLRPEDGYSWFFRGQDLATRGYDMEADLCFTQSVRLLPHHAEAFFNLGLMARRRGGTVTADQAFAEALKLKPSLSDKLRH